MNNDLQHVIVIREALDEIEKHTANGKSAFENDCALQELICEHLAVIGEAAGSFSRAIQKTHPDVDWSRVTAMNSFVEYRKTGFDPEIVWLSIEQDLPSLRDEMRAIFETIETQVGV